MFTRKFQKILALTAFLTLVSAVSWAAYGRSSVSSFRVGYTGSSFNTGFRSSSFGSHRSYSSSPLSLHRGFGSKSLMSRPLLRGIYNRPNLHSSYSRSYKPYNSRSYNRYPKPYYSRSRYFQPFKPGINYSQKNPYYYTYPGKYPSTYNRPYKKYYRHKPYYTSKHHKYPRYKGRR
jgi:hypothetical protein